MLELEADDDFDAVLSGDVVLKRVLEYLGQTNLASPSCVYVGRCDAENPAVIERFPVVDAERLVREGSGIARSLFDTRSVIVHLDVEYVNFDAPATAFTDPWQAFWLQESVVAVIEELLANWGIRPLHLITGQGHHFVWQIPRSSSVARRLSHLVPASDSDGSEQVFGNLGLVMEYLAHRIKAESQTTCEVPVEITALQVGPGRKGQREMVSIDISEYGDPIDSRTIRVPFTRYLKPWRSGVAQRCGVEDQIGPCVTIPLHEIDVMQALKFRQDASDVEQLARRCSMAIPNQIKGTGHLIDDYLASDLRMFHQRFYEAQHDPPELWSETYGRTPLDALPGCARHVLLFPNDLLLKPSGMRLVTRCLLLQGWHPRHIAGLVRSKFEDPAFGWGDRWQGYSPGFRADFYVRLFAGQIATGLDNLDDMNCDAERARGYCFALEKPCDLGVFRDANLPCRIADLTLFPREGNDHD